MVRIAITGTMGVGKTTLAEDLATVLKLKLLPEVARMVAKKGFKLDKEITAETELMMARIQQELEHGDNWIADRCFIDLLAYVSILFPQLKNKIRQFLFKAKYDIIIYIPIEFPLEEDGVRSTDKKFQIKVDREIRKILKEFKYYIIKGEPLIRLNKVLKIYDNSRSSFSKTSR